MYLFDSETNLDLLNYQTIVSAIEDVIKSSDNTVTIGVHGDWGAGKSSILRMLQEKFEGSDTDTLCIWFNGWLFQDFEDAKIAVLEKLLVDIESNKKFSEKIKKEAISLFKKIDWLKIVKHGAKLAPFIATGVPTLGSLEVIGSSMSQLIDGTDKQVDISDLKKLSEQYNSLLKTGSIPQVNVPQQIEAVRKELQALLEKAKVSKVVVLIDDLDRCLPKTAIETLEAIKLFLFLPKISFVIAADEKMIEFAVKEHFPHHISGEGSNNYPRNYLEKMIQIPFRIPDLGPRETKVYVLLLLAGRVYAENSSEIKELRSRTKDFLQKPLEDLDFVTFISKDVGFDVSSISAEIHVANQIAYILNQGTKGNPRQIKRFINSLLIRLKVAESLGIQENIKIPLALKLMLLERFRLDIYLQIANEALNDSDGCSKSIIDFEAYIYNTNPKKKMPIPKGWEENKWLKIWAAITPKFEKDDLRPYFLAAKDNNKAKIGIEIHPELAELYTDLLGPKTIVTRRHPDIAKLSLENADSLFSQLITEVRNQDLKHEPKGIYGLSEISKCHTTLQIRLVKFFEGLPHKDLGIWAVSSWITNITESTARDLLEKLLVKWSKQTDNKKLQLAANTIQNITKRNA